MRYEIVPIDKLDPNKFREVDQDRLVLKHLKQSMENYGILEPIHITKDYAILDGIKRYDIAKEIGIVELPCIVHEDIKDLEDAVIKRIVLNRIRNKMPYHNIAENIKKTDLHKKTTAIDFAETTGVPFSVMQIANSIAKENIGYDNDLARKLVLVNNISDSLSKTNIKLLDSFLRESTRFTWKQLIKLRHELNLGHTVDFKFRADTLTGEHKKFSVYLPLDVYEKYQTKCKLLGIDMQKQAYDMILKFLEST